MQLQPSVTSRYSPFDIPVGLLGDIEIQFPHCQNFESAKKKWDERVQRLRGNRLFIIGSDQDLCTPEIIHRFNALPYPNKILFSATSYPHLKSVVWLEEYRHLDEIPNIIDCREWLKHIDIVDWFNKGAPQRGDELFNVGHSAAMTDGNKEAGKTAVLDVIVPPHPADQNSLCDAATDTTNRMIQIPMSTNLLVSPTTPISPMANGQKPFPLTPP